MANRVANPGVIQELRIRSKITASAFARAAGIGRSTLYRIERGTQVPTDDTLQRIADALKIDVELITYPVVKADAA